MGCLMAILVAYCKQECGHLEEALRQVSGYGRWCLSSVIPHLTNYIVWLT